MVGSHEIRKKKMMIGKNKITKEKQKIEGAHFTPPILADFVVDQMLGYKPLSSSATTISLLDPSVGEGELIIAFINKMPLALRSKLRIVGYDINKLSLNIASQRIRELAPEADVVLRCHDFLNTERDLFNQANIELNERFDYVIANPPYIRTQNLGATNSQKISRQWGLSGRIDAYQAFMLAVFDYLNIDGIAGFITSNRFLSIKGCGAFRSSFWKRFDIKRIFDFGDTELFSAAVLPAVTIFSLYSNNRNATAFHSIYQERSLGDVQNIPMAKDPIEAIKNSGIVKTLDGNIYSVRTGTLDFASPSDIWTLSDLKSSSWLAQVEAHTFCRFRDIGKVRVGVKTTADDVFIHDSWLDETGVEPELLQPLLTHAVAECYKRRKNITTQILYTHQSIKGRKQAVDLEQYPISKQYLYSHYERLSGRSYIAKAKRNWYEIWVPQNPSLWKKLKIVFRDITEHPCFWMEDQEVIVNGDCYWMTLDSDKFSEDILWLILAIANSTFIEKFYDNCFNNKLYSNKRRFISQYVEQFPVPDPQSHISQEIVSLCKTIFEFGISVERKEKVDQLVYQAFGC